MSVCAASVNSILLTAVTVFLMFFKNCFQQYLTDPFFSFCFLYSFFLKLENIGLHSELQGETNGFKSFKTNLQTKKLKLTNCILFYLLCIFNLTKNRWLFCSISLTKCTVPFSISGCTMGSLELTKVGV